ncbi:hypothetical protein BC830DRAFT_425797 [Chytriomyces sp. MP71]|nr:hypothetical protein BC830DRAFT_425797 [Chytriomyces sp. MP71]
MSLNQIERSGVSTAVRGEVTAAVAARLYFANESEGAWRLDGTGAAVVSGAQLHFVDLRVTALRFCLLLGPTNARVCKERRSIFVADVGGADWKYNADRRFFHSFPSQKDRRYVAFSFADDDEADDFAEKVQSATSFRGRNSTASQHSNSQGSNHKLSVSSMDSRPYGAPPQLPQHPSPAAAAPQLPSRSQTNLVVPPSMNKSSSAPMGAANGSVSSLIDVQKPVKDDSDLKRESSSGGFFSGMFGKKKKDAETSSVSGKKEKKEKKKSASGGTGKIDKSMISAPSNFEHLSHVGFNKESGFTAQNIPMEWKAIFAKAGITEEQLQDKKTANRPGYAPRSTATAALPSATSPTSTNPECSRGAPTASRALRPPSPNRTQRSASASGKV